MDKGEINEDTGLVTNAFSYMGTDDEIHQASVGDEIDGYEVAFFDKCRLKLLNEHLSKRR
ncbi:MAG: hypothetical protein IJ532_01500 [Alphaproteobacteria bacterium]|nr:hypothetical protein [Alphaproteobacteria bacterium]